MSFTNFPNGLTSFGIPLFGGGPGRSASGAPSVSTGVTSVIGNTWFVDTAYGSDGNTGLGPNQPFQTMARAFAGLRSGDVINFRGRVNEQLVTPPKVFDVWVNGLGDQPRQADPVPSGGNLAAAQWTGAGGTAGVANLRVIHQGWRFTNIQFTAQGSTAACLEFVATAPTDPEDELSGGRAQVIGCWFMGAGVGIRVGVPATIFTENVGFVQVIGCNFNNLTAAFIGGPVFGMFGWQILDNTFWGNTNHIVCPAGGSQIARNFFGPGATGSVVIAGGAAAPNIATLNYFSAAGFTVAAGFSGDVTDEWAGNLCKVATGSVANTPWTTIAPT